MNSSRSNRKECSITDCPKKVQARGWCATHYKRWHVHGDPLTKLTAKGESVFNTLASYTLISDDCWFWIGHRDKDGYGNVTIDGRTHRAHRAWYEEMRGPIPEGLETDHLCRHTWCVNPWHLEMVTHLENLRRRGDPPAIPLKHAV